MPRAVRPGGADQTDQGRQRHRRCRRRSYLPVQPGRQDLQGPLPVPQRLPPVARRRPAAASATAAGRAARTATSSTSSMHMEKVEFPEARRILAEPAGIKLDDGAVARRTRPAAGCSTSCAGPQAKYQHVPARRPARPRPPASTSAAGSSPARRSATSASGSPRSPATGWSGSPPRTASPPDVLVEVGLIAARDENRGYYDRFRDRVMFPIRDVRGQTVGFGGRIMPDSPLAARGPEVLQLCRDARCSRKSDLLYGLDLARHAGAAAGYLAVVEGYTDVMMAHQCGVPQVVATMGTALNARHVPQLRAVRPEGGAGVRRRRRRATRRRPGAGDVRRAGRGTRRRHPARRAGPVRPARPARRGRRRSRRPDVAPTDALDFKLDSAAANATPSRPSRATRRIVDDVLGVHGRWPRRCPSASAQVKQELIVTRLAHRLGLRQETVWARLGELQAGAASRSRRPRPRPGAGRRPAADEAAAGPKAGPADAAEQQLLEIAARRAGPGAGGGRGRVARTTLTHTGLRRMLSRAVRSAGRRRSRRTWTRCGCG